MQVNRDRETVTFFSLCRDLKVNQANKAPEDQWEQLEMRGQLEQKALEEKKGRMVQKGLKEPLYGNLKLYTYCMNCGLSNTLYFTFHLLYFREGMGLLVFLVMMAPW